MMFSDYSFQGRVHLLQLCCLCRAGGVCESVSISSVCVELRWDPGEIIAQVELPPPHTEGTRKAHWLISTKCTFFIFNGLAANSETATAAASSAAPPG